MEITVDIPEEEQEKEAFIDVSRICEYCEVKLDNTQIDTFYQLGKEWRKRDQIGCEKLLVWYEMANEDIDEGILKEKDSMNRAEV